MNHTDAKQLSVVLTARFPADAVHWKRLADEIAKVEKAGNSAIGGRPAGFSLPRSGRSVDST